MAAIRCAAISSIWVQPTGSAADRLAGQNSNRTGPICQAFKATGAELDRYEAEMFAFLRN